MASPRPGGRFTVTNMPLWALIGTAWELPDFRIVGGNKELMNTKYHITAKASGGATLGLKQNLPLLKNLIVERFQLKFHVEPREMSHYDLVLARSDGRLGPELKPSKSDCSNEDELNAQRGDAALTGDLGALVPKPGEFLSCTIAPNLAGGPTNLSLHGDGQELKTLADVLSQFTGKYVRDKTGHPTTFDLKSNYAINWGSWNFFTPPVPFAIEFLDEERTRASVQLGMGGSGMTILLEKARSEWRFVRVVSISSH
jgi:uncharacterized protein (TIGR03435 family)